MINSSDNDAAEEMQMMELQSTQEGLESILKSMQSHKSASAQLAKAFKQQAMLYPKEQEHHAILKQLSTQHLDEDATKESKLACIIEAYQEFLGVGRKEYVAKRDDYQSKQTKLQKSKKETPELQHAADESQSEFERFKSEVYEPKLNNILSLKVITTF